MPRIDYSKVKTLSVEGSTLYVWYKSGVFRRFEVTDLAAIKAQAEAAGKVIHGADPAFRYEQTGKGKPAPESTPDPTTVSFVALVEMLGLTPDQAKHLAGAERLNFWRNGCLNVQVQHGCRGTKLACPQAKVTDADLVLFFLSWGWEQLGQKLYFKPNAASLVRL
ncbi:MAG: hypothetical protein HS126_19025 [Anaerolineales bacterium]|nr:hypothetical protein [Anaerolineales bacterium]